MADFLMDSFDEWVFDSIWLRAFSIYATPLPVDHHGLGLFVEGRQDCLFLPAIAASAGTHTLCTVTTLRYAFDWTIAGSNPPSPHAVVLVLWPKWSLHNTVQPWQHTGPLWFSSAQLSAAVVSVILQCCRVITLDTVVYLCKSLPGCTNNREKL